jgi:hypothetical protein
MFPVFEGMNTPYRAKFTPKFGSSLFSVGGVSKEGA